MSQIEVEKVATAGKLSRPVRVGWGGKDGVHVDYRKGI